ncbi:MAG TPA: thiamine pyrophosphate-dependent enzyme [Steroidobacteraceae bacterium]|jgi:thiamine pyrophosphate-dependent acetolactate synthase large subunit-like protein|nr:thiamine pyrophosphate-dependent enzyme [Steroidobacteraceae bacterium]
MKRNGSDILIDCLIAWGVNTIFGLPGDGINGVIEAIRKRADRIRFIQVRHEESAALMACAYSKWTGRLGCCLATTGPGGVHLLNGLYDAKFDKASVIAITGLPYHDLIDTFTQQDVDLPKLFADVAAYSTRIMSAAHVENAVTLACRIACTQHAVSHVAIPTDVQEESLDEVEASTRNVEHHVSFARQESERVPEEPEIARALEILNRGKRVAILAGHGALDARDELLEVAELLGAPIVKALLGKAVVPDDHPLTTGGIGLLGTRASQEVFEECDTLLIVGSTFPYVEYYPKPGQARGVQIDRDATRIGLRFPVEVGLVGSAKKTLRILSQRLKAHAQRGFLERAQRRKLEWNNLLEHSLDNGTGRLTPGKLAHEVGLRLADDALVAWDSGHNTGVLARYAPARGSQKFSGSGLLATMACSIPYAVAAALALPGRQVVAFTGDGGLSMLLGELATIVRYKLPIKIVVMKNNSLGQIKWEQLQFLGNPEFECDLTPIDFAKAAEAFGITGFRTDSPDSVGAVLDRAFSLPGPALIEATVDPHEPLLPAKRIEKFARNLEKAMEAGTRDAPEIRAALEREPSRTQLRGDDEPNQRIGAEGTEAPGEPRRSGVPHLSDDEEQLDAALANTFPASDPVGAKHIDDGTSPRRRQ